MYGNPPGPGPRPEDPDTQPLAVSSERQRAAIALGVLAIAALVLVAIMIAVLGSSGSDPGPTKPVAGPSGPAVTVTGGPGGSTTPAKPPLSTEPRPKPVSHGPVSCPTRAPCAMPDDTGDALGALNAYRAAHGKAAVGGRVTAAAKGCAMSSGGSCPNGYFWEPVGRSGREVIQKISNGSDGRSWLLDPRMTVVQIGWAFIPASHSFECAIISNA